MKKKNLKNLSLNKQVIASGLSGKIIGGIEIKSGNHSACKTTTCPTKG